MPAMKADYWNKVDQRSAERRLGRIQRDGKPVAMRLTGVPVSVEPLPGNMFRIALDMSLPGADKAARRLNDAGTDIRPWPAQGAVHADATWDTSVHYLVMTGDLA